MTTTSSTQACDVLVSAALPFSQDQWSRLLQAFHGKAVAVVDPQDDAAMRAALETARIAIIATDLDVRFLRAPHLEWVHCDHAGLNRSARSEVFERGLAVTGSAGRSAPALAEHALLLALMLAHRSWIFLAAQARQEWLRSPEIGQLRALSGRCMGIVGMGNTGRELARRAKAFGMMVLAYRRRDQEKDEGVDEVYSSDRGDQLADMLVRCDVIVLCLSLSDATTGLIGREELLHLPRGALLVNMARGEVVDQHALVDLLEEGHLAGAGLDVTAPEPLPAGHPLWSAPNTLITPHFTPPVPDRSERSLEIILENIRRFDAGETMINLLRQEDAYTADA